MPSPRPHVGREEIQRGEENQQERRGQAQGHADGQNSLKAGPRRPTLLEGFVLREKIFHFDHERIRERVVHARGYGAHGVFELTDSLSAYTRADVFGTVGQQTEMFVRFSTMGSPTHLSASDQSTRISPLRNTAAFAA